MDKNLRILRHSLGLNPPKIGKQYRNHFVTGPGSKDFDACRALVVAGMMTEREGSDLSGGNVIFHVTQKGIDFAAKTKKEE